MSFWLVIHSNKQTPSLFPQQGDCGSAAYCNDQWEFQLLIKCRASSCWAVLRGPSEPQLVWSHLETVWFLTCVSEGVNSQTVILVGLSAVAFIIWIDELILREWICWAQALRWCKCLTPVLSSGNNDEALLQRFSFTFAFCIASNALRGVFSHVLQKMIENLPGCIEWAEVSFRETAVWEVLVSHKSSGDSPLHSLL